MVEVVAFGSEGCGFECSHRVSASLIDSRLVAAARFLKNNMHFYLEKRWEERKATYTVRNPAIGAKVGFHPLVVEVASNLRSFGSNNLDDQLSLR